MGMAFLTVFTFRAPNAWQKRYGPCALFASLAHLASIVYPP
jgi:hypothetical protein